MPPSHSSNLRRWLAAAVLALGPASAAQAEDVEEPASLLARARQAEAKIDYNGALSLVRKALAQGGANSTLTWKLYVAEAEFESAVGLQEDATRAFARALVLNPTVELPPDSSPRLLSPFRKAREQVGQNRLAAVPSSERLEHQQVRTRVRVDGDVLQLVAAARLTPIPGTSMPLARSDVFEGYWGCTKEPCAHYVTLLDARGNELVGVGSAEAPLMVLAAPAPIMVVDDRPWFRRGWPYLIAGAALAAGATYFATHCAQTDAAFRAARDNPDQNTYAKVRALDGERWSSYVAAVSGFGLAAGAGALGVVWW